MLYSNLEKNIAIAMSNYDLKVAYALEDIVGSQQELDIDLVFDIYYEK